MAFAPQQDWSAYDELTRAEHAEWIRSLSPQDRFSLYEDMFNLIWQARDKRADLDRLDQWRWEQKLAARMRQVEAFTKLDQLRRERAAASNGADVMIPVQSQCASGP
jgi:hypothetical protein